MIARIRAVTRRSLRRTPAHGGSDNFTLDDLEVRPAELRAARGDELFELSLRDLKILQLLYQHQGKVVSRDTLFDRCWGREYLPSSRTLDQHISKLRKLIEHNPREPRIIKTVHGSGYRYDN